MEDREKTKEQLIQELEAARREERTCRELLENLPDLVFTLDTKGTVTSVNKTCKPMFGHDPEEVIGTSFTQWIPAERLELEQTSFERFLRGDGKDVVESQAVDKDGNIHSIEISAAPILEGDRFVGIRGIVRDISARKKIEEALRQSEQNYKLLVEGAGQAVFTIDHDGVFQFMNTNAAAQLRGTPTDFIGKNMWDLFPKVHADRQMSTVRQVIKSGKTSTAVEETIIAGKARWYETRIQPVSDAEGNVNSVICVANDITQRKQAEQALQESRARLALAEQIAHVGHWDWHIDTDYRFWSDETYRIFGQDPQAFEPGLDDLLSRVAPDQRGLIIEARDRALRGEEPYDLELNITTADGRKRIVRSQAKVFYDDSNKPVRMLGTVQDITEAKLAQDQIQEERNKLQSIIGAMDDGLSIHNLNYEIIYENDVLKRLFGDHIGEKCYHIYEGRDHVCEDCPVKLAFEDGQSHTSERRVTMPSGDTGYWENTASPIRDAAGKIVACLEIAREVTERRRADQALRYSEQRFRTLIHNIPGMVYRARADWSADIIANSEVICGYTAEDFNSDTLNWLNIIHPDDRERAQRLSASLKSEPASQVQQYRIIDSKGKVRWVEDHKIAQFADDGSFEYVNGVVYDVTDRKRAEQALRDSEERYRTLFEGSTEGIIVADAETRRFKYANPAMCTMLGYSQAEIIGKGLSDLHPTDTLQEVTKRFDARARGAKFTAPDTPLLRKDGSIIHTDVGAASVVIDDRPCVVGFFTDITERKKTRDALADSEEKYRRLVENLEREYFFYSHDTDGVFTYISPSIENVLNYSQDEFKTHYSEFLTDNPINKEVVRHSNLSIAGEPQPPYLVEIYDKDHSIHMLEVSEAPVFDEKGDVVAVDGIAHDITELLRAKEELQKAHDELEMRVEQRTSELAKANRELLMEIAERTQAQEKLAGYQEQLRSLASEVSLAEERVRRRIAIDLHDHIGQTLATSKMKLDLLRSAPPDQDTTESLQEISRLIAETIESSRTLTFELSPPVLYELGLEAALDWLVRQARQRYGLDAQFEDDAKPKPVQDNVRILLFQAVRELIANVAKHADAATMTVKVSRITGKIKIAVIDDGTGFDTARLDVGRHQPAGFGLFSIRERLTSIGGEFTIQSRDDVGTTVTLTAPVIMKQTK